MSSPNNNKMKVDFSNGLTTIFKQLSKVFSKQQQQNEEDKLIFFQKKLKNNKKIKNSLFFRYKIRASETEYSIF
jgi:hypothetical protein